MSEQIKTVGNSDYGSGFSVFWYTENGQTVARRPFLADYRSVKKVKVEIHYHPGFRLESPEMSGRHFIKWMLEISHQHPGSILTGVRSRKLPSRHGLSLHDRVFLYNAWSSLHPSNKIAWVSRLKKLGMSPKEIAARLREAE